MPIPAGNITTVNLDATTDSPATARVDLLALTQQFNALIASANGVSGMAALDASGFLAGYGRLSAPQTWTGVNTFSSASALRMTSGAPALWLMNTALALPNGLWNLSVGGDGNFYYSHNTAAAGDFSTYVTPFSLFGGANGASFLGSVSVAAATAAGHAVNKGQLDAKVYGGQVNSTGAAIYLPSGWSSSRTSVGVYVITHNLGTTLYAPVASANGGTVATSAGGITTTTFGVTTFNSTTGSATDVPFNFVVARN